MSIRSISVVLLAITCGASTAVGVHQLRKPATAADKVETTPVLVAKVAIARGSMVTAEALETRAWPKDFVPANTLTKVEDAVDRSAVAPMLPGEPVLDGKLAPKDSGRGLAALVPKGMRAYTMQTARIASNVAGFILPGNHVDVLMTMRSNTNDASGGGTTTTLLQAVEILAVDQRLDAPAENKTDPDDLRSVTLLVSPEQAAVLDLGQNLGMLTLSLRNPEDQESHDLEQATLSSLRFNGDAPPAVAASATPAETEPAAEKPQTMEIRTLRGHMPGRLTVEVRQ